MSQEGQKDHQGQQPPEPLPVHPAIIQKARSVQVHQSWDRETEKQLFIYYFFILPLLNQVGKLRTSSHLQLQPGQDKAKQFDRYNDTELHMELNKHTVNNTV